MTYSRCMTFGAIGSYLLASCLLIALHSPECCAHQPVSHHKKKEVLMILNSSLASPLTPEKKFQITYFCEINWSTLRKFSSEQADALQCVCLPVCLSVCLYSLNLLRKIPFHQIKSTQRMD